MAFNQKNPPWQRNAGQSIAGMQAIVSFPQAQPVFNQNIGLQQQQNLGMIPQMGLQQQQIYSQTVQYPTSRPMNTIAFQNQPQAQQSQQVSQGSSKFNPNQRVFSGTGHVTKVQNDFGFIDEEVFFHKNVCKGSFPKVGDRVLVEAAYNQNMPFKWNATRVQVLQSASSSSMNSSSNSSRHVSSYNQNTSSDRSGRNRYSPARKSPDRHGHRSSHHDSRQREVDDDDRRRRRDDRDSDRYRDKQRERTPDRRERERSPVRKLSPKRRKVRPIPRYMVTMPKQLLSLKHADILELRRRYYTLYIPSDFFTSEIRWIEAFPPNEPFSIKKPCAFHVMHKEVEPLHANDTNLEPADSDYLYSAKVMLMSTPPMTDFYQKCFPTAEERDRYEDERDFVHPTRLINFLVGIRGKNESMAIGGPWSPSMDGENPDTNPNVLIKTAIRTCKGLTGIDLSNCTRWYRFVELYYRRSETYHKGRLIPARIETVVIFLPDVRSCQPTHPEWDELHISYKSHLERIINSQSSDSPVPAADPSPPAVAEAEAAVAAQQNSSVGEKAASSSDSKPTADDSSKAAEASGSTGATNETSDPTEPLSSVDIKEEKSDVAEAAAEDNEKDDADAADESTTVVKREATTNLSLADLKKMKVAELKAELEARDLPTDGVKNVLVTRLTKALKQEKPDAGDKDLEDNDEHDTSKEGDLETAKEDKPASAEKGDTEAVKEVKAEAVKKGETETAKESETEAAKKDETVTDNDSAEDVVIVEPEKVAEKPDDEEFETMENVDMSEVTVIDEYDSTKSEEKSNDETAAAKKSVKLTEKERQLLEKRYSLPEQPHIIVHPSRTAKSGKFDCAVMSLSVLLDYRPEDSKEHSFEVSLFAELFNEMLTRDFGFNIYKALYALPAKKEDEPKKEAGSEDEKKVNGDGAKDKEKSTEADVKAKDDKDDKEKERPKQRDRENRKRSRFDDVSDEDRRRQEKEKEKEKEKDRVKFYTADRELLLSFTYFDVSHCGYIFDKDIEDLFYTLGLHLSRSQIRRLVSKGVTRDSLYYRKLTDKVKETVEEIIEIKEDENDTEKDEAATAEPTAEAAVEVVKDEPEAVVEISEDELKEMSIGNSNYVEQLKVNLELVLKAEAGEDDDKPPAKKIKLEPVQDENDIPQTNSGLVVHNGGVLDIPKILEQMRRFEKAREDTEILLVELRRQNSELLKGNTRSNEKIKDQGTELKTLQRKLVDSEQNLREYMKKSNDYFSTLSNVYDRVSTVIHRADPKRSSSITSSKRASSRDRSSRKDAKPKDKEAEPQKETEKTKADDKTPEDASDMEIVVANSSDSKESIESKQSEPTKSDDGSKSSEEKKDAAPADEVEKE